jgi:hypothetical protein
MGNVTCAAGGARIGWRFERTRTDIFGTRWRRDRPASGHGSRHRPDSRGTGVMRDDAEVGAPCGPWRDCPYISLRRTSAHSVHGSHTPHRSTNLAGFFYAFCALRALFASRWGSLWGSVPGDVVLATTCIRPVQSHSRCIRQQARVVLKTAHDRQGDDGPPARVSLWRPLRCTETPLCAPLRRSTAIHRGTLHVAHLPPRPSRRMRRWSGCSRHAPEDALTAGMEGRVGTSLSLVAARRPSSGCMK